MGAPAAHALRGMLARVACGRALAGGGGCEWLAVPALDRSALWTSGATFMGRRRKHTGTDDGKDGGEGSGAQETAAESSSPPAEASGGDSTAPAEAGRGPSPTLESYLGEIQRIRKSDKKRASLVGEDIGEVPRGMPRAARGSYADLPLDAARLPERLRRAPIGEPELRSLAKETFGLGRIENDTLISELESTFGRWRPGTSARSVGDPAQSPEQQQRRRRQKQDGGSADAVSDGGGGPLHWSSKMVVEPGKVGYVNPLNRKVRAWFHVRDLQEHYGLSDAALARIIRLVGPRYKSDAGVVTITSDRKALREENRAEIIRIILDLVREGRRADEFVGDAESTASQQQERSSL